MNKMNEEKEDQLNIETQNCPIHVAWNMSHVAHKSRCAHRHKKAIDAHNEAILKRGFRLGSDDMVKHYVEIRKHEKALFMLEMEDNTQF